MSKKKIGALLALVLLACSLEAQERLANDKMAVSIDRNGRLTELRNLGTGTDYAGSGALWRLYFDTPEQQEVQVSGELQVQQVERRGEAIVISCSGMRADSRIEGPLNFSLILTITLEEDKVRFASTLENHEPHTIIRELQCPLVGDLALPEGHRLLTTYGGGQLIDDVKKHIAAEGIKSPYMTPAQYYRQKPLEYPRGAVAANCFALVGEKEGLYFGSHDTRFVNTGHGLRVYPSAAGVFDRLECGFYKYPNIVCGQSWQCDANVIAPYSGTWTETSRLYRRWVDAAWWDRRCPPRWVQEMKSWQRVIFKHQYGEYFFRYKDLPGRILDVEKSVDSDAVLLFGWWNSGMDNSNPDYVSDASQGGDAALKEAIARYQEAGGRAALYFNGKLIDRKSGFYRSGAANGLAFTGNDGTESIENYKFSSFGSFLGKYNYRNFVVADTRDPAWQKLMLSWVDKAAALGASSIFYDQMGSVENNAVNWDVSGEFPIPDLAPLTAKAGILKKCRDKVRATSPEMAMGAEHITDLLCMYVDYTHGDGLLSMIDWFRYTFPELIISDRCIRDDTDIERRVNLTVLKGLRNDIEIFRCRGLIDETPHYQAYLAQVNALKDRFSDLLLKGRFSYKDFFTSKNDNVEARSFVNGNALAIVLTSEEDRAQKTRLEVPGYKFSAYGTIGKATVSRDGKKVKLGKHGLAVLVFEKEV
ncbi:MAG: hypothetical protein IJQ61_07470 [Bacteroidales bacterium]|nr:hypothetical protein [Bacteroidales bacterium]